MVFSEVLKMRREAAGLSQPELAEKAGVSVGTIRNYEQGLRADPQWSIIQKLSAALGIPCGELAADEPAPVETKKKRAK